MPDCTDWYGAIIVILIAVICVLIVRLYNAPATERELQEYVMSDLRAATKAAVTAGFLDSSSESEGELETKLITDNGANEGGTYQEPPSSTELESQG